jgi:hypothetical protein
MGLSNLLPLPLLVIALIGSGIVAFISAKLVWHQNEKVTAISLISLGLNLLMLSVNYLNIEFNRKQIIPDLLLVALFSLFIILLIIGALLKIKKEDNLKLIKFSIFLLLSFLIMIILYISI